MWTRTRLVLARSGFIQSAEVIQQNADMCHTLQMAVKDGTAAKARLRVARWGNLPTLTGDRGKVLCAFAVVRLKESEYPKIEIMTHKQLIEIKDRSKAKSKGPWVVGGTLLLRQTVQFYSAVYTKMVYNQGFKVYLRSSYRAKTIIFFSQYLSFIQLISIFAKVRKAFNEEVIHLAFLVCLACQSAGFVSDAHINVTSAWSPDRPSGVLVEGKAAVQFVSNYAAAIHRQMCADKS